MDAKAFPGAVLRSDMTFWPVVFALVLATRLPYAIAYPVEPFHHNTSDAAWYYQTAINIASGQGYSINGVPTAYFPVGYPVFLSIFFKLFGPSYLLAKLLNVGLDLVICFFTYQIGKVMFGVASGRVAAVFLAISPGHIIWSGMVFSELLFTALFTAAVFVSLPNPRTGLSLPRQIITGVLIGLASLVRGQALLLPLVFFGLFVVTQRSYLRPLQQFLGIAGAMLLIVLPWTVRNTVTLGAPVLVSTNAGINLYIGNHPGANGGWSEPPVRVSDGTEVSRDQAAMMLAIQFIRDNPLDFVKLAPVKVYKLFRSDSSWTFRGDLIAKLRPAGAFALLGLAELWYLSAVLLSLLAVFKKGILRKLIENRQSWVILLILGYFAFAAILFFGSVRYNFPLNPFWAVLSAASVTELRGQRKDRSS